MAGGDGSDQENAKDGRTRVSDAEILEALETGKDRLNTPALSTSDIAEFLPISRQAVKRRLENLADEGQIGVHQAGRNRFWWISDEVSRAGHFELDEVVGVGDLSDEKLIQLFFEQIDPGELPDEVVDELINSHMAPENIQNETLFDALEQNVEYTDIPDFITSDIAQDVYGFDTSHWATHIRVGIRLLAGSLLTYFFFLVALSISPSSFPLPFVSPEAKRSAIQTISLILFLTATIFFASGVFASVFGLLGRRFSSTDDPRPWRNYIRNVIRSNL